MKKLAIINGPNLNLLGTREPEIYGSQTFESFFQGLEKKYQSLELSYFQSNIEGELIDLLQSSIGNFDGIILNPGGYSHTSVALADCITAINIPVIEVHISNIYKRESFRHQSLTGAASRGIITGLGIEGYRLAVEFLSNH